METKKELRSNGVDCLELSVYLSQKLKNKIDFTNSVLSGIPEGKYRPIPENFHNGIEWLWQYGIPFYFKYCKDGFLRLGVGDSIYHETSMGEKLAALSDFYLALQEKFGEPTVFYTTKDDDEGLITLQWSFINKEEDIAKFKNNSMFDDADIDELIVIGEPIAKMPGYQLSAETKKIISHQVGLPFDLLSIVDENMAEYQKFKALAKSPFVRQRIPKKSANL